MNPDNTESRTMTQDTAALARLKAMSLALSTFVTEFSVGETYVNGEPGEDGHPETVIRSADGEAGIAVCLDFGENNPTLRDAFAAYFAALGPGVILALIAQLEAQAEPRADLHKDTTEPATQAGSGDAARDVLAERQRQKDVEGWTSEHDDKYGDSELPCAAACYAMSIGSPDSKPMNFWPWDASWWKPAGERRNLVKAAALILAELERLDRASSKEKKS